MLRYSFRASTGEWDLGQSGGLMYRDAYLSRNLSVGGNSTLTGAVITSAIGPTPARQHVLPNSPSDTLALIGINNNWAATQTFGATIHSGLVTIQTTGSMAFNGSSTLTQGASSVWTLDGAVTGGGTVLMNGPASKIGYAAGAGGAVAQTTNKSTAVTLNRPTGVITMNGAALAANAVATFTLNNSVISGQDVVVVQHDSVGTLGDYDIHARSSAGSATISVRNVSGGSLSEAIAIRFVCVRGAAT